MKRQVGFWFLSVIASQACAESPVSVDANGHVAFSRLDSDSNGYVSRVEARSVVVVEQAFDSADSNRDGLLNREEYTSVRVAREAE
jgi:Ca2+-binding EF-hand superfamily protein